MASTALAIIGGLSAIGGVGSSIIGSNASKKAASQESSTVQQGINETNQQFQQEQANQAPYLAAGSQSLAQLLAGLNNGTFGPGSTPSYTLPTLAQAENEPGFQFQEQQGDKAIQESAAATGGAFSGGTAKSLDNYNTNLAQTDYQNVVSNSLNAYQQNLANQAQQFSQLLAPVQIGEGATQNINQAGTQTSQTIAQLLASLGQSQAAGTVGSANAINSGITGATNGISQTALLSLLGIGPGGLKGGVTTPSTQPASNGTSVGVS